jgi:hypothetical protein
VVACVIYDSLKFHGVLTWGLILKYRPRIKTMPPHAISGWIGKHLTGTTTTFASNNDIWDGENAIM